MTLIVSGSWIHNYLMSNEYTDYAAEEKKHTDTHPVNKIYIMHKWIYFFFLYVLPHDKEFCPAWVQNYETPLGESQEY